MRMVIRLAQSARMNNALVPHSLTFPGNLRESDCSIFSPPFLCLVGTNWPLAFLLSAITFPPWAIRAERARRSWHSLFFTFTHSSWHSWGVPHKALLGETTQRADYCIAAGTTRLFFPNHSSHKFHSPRTDAFKLSSKERNLVHSFEFDLHSEALRLLRDMRSGFTF